MQLSDFHFLIEDMVKVVTDRSNYDQYLKENTTIEDFYDMCPSVGDADLLVTYSYQISNDIAQVLKPLNKLLNERVSYSSSEIIFHLRHDEIIIDKTSDNELWKVMSEALNKGVLAMWWQDKNDAGVDLFKKYSEEMNALSLRIVEMVFAYWNKENKKEFYSI